MNKLKNNKGRFQIFMEWLKSVWTRCKMNSYRPTKFNMRILLENHHLDLKWRVRPIISINRWTWSSPNSTPLDQTALKDSLLLSANIFPKDWDLLRSETLNYHKDQNLHDKTTRCFRKPITLNHWNWSIKTSHKWFRDLFHLLLMDLIRRGLNPHWGSHKWTEELGRERAITLSTNFRCSKDSKKWTMLTDCMMKCKIVLLNRRGTVKSPPKTEKLSTWSSNQKWISNHSKIRCSTK